MEAFSITSRVPPPPVAPRSRRQCPSRAFFGDENGAGSSSSSNGAGQQYSIQHPLFPEAQPAAGGPLPVATQRGLPLFQPVIGDPPCPACAGTGKTTCGDCRGKGRLNYRGASMLPQGAWPQWCPSCRASGRWCCARCMGTGVKRGPIGFRPADDDDDEQ